MEAIHLHIPKNAGGTVLHLLNRAYGTRNILAIPARDWELVRPFSLKDKLAVSGHFPFDAINFWGIDGFKFTFLRDPLDRVASLYAYITARPSHRAYNLLLGYSPQEFAEHGPFDNCQVRMLAGMHDFQWFTKEKREVTPADYATAIHNLGKLDLVGDVAFFDLYIDFIAAELDWDIALDAPRIHKSAEKPTIELTPEVERKWRWDFALYEYFLSTLRG